MSNRETTLHTRTHAPILAALCFLGLLGHGNAPAMSLEKVTDGNGIDTVVMTDQDGKRHELTNFKRPTRVWKFCLSPNERHVLVWFESSPPKKLAIFRTDTGNMESQVAPKASSGDIFWVNGDTILNTWGDGADCQNMEFYVAEDGIDQNFCSGTKFELSPDKQYYATFPSKKYVEESTETETEPEPDETPDDPAEEADNEQPADASTPDSSEETPRPAITIWSLTTYKAVCVTELAPENEVEDFFWEGEGKARALLTDSTHPGGHKEMIINFKDGCKGELRPGDTVKQGQ